MALAVLIDGVDQVDALQWGSLRITDKATAFATRADFTLRNVTPTILTTLVISDGATTYFDGFVLSVRTREWTPGEWFCEVSGNDDTTAHPTVKAPFSLSDQSPADTLTSVLASWVTQPIAWWRLGEASGTTAADEEGFRDGTYVNTPTLGVTGALTGITDTAVTFARASTEYVDCGASMLAGGAAFAIAAWVKFTDKSATNIVYCERAVGETRYLRLYTDTSGHACFDYRTSSTAVVVAGTVDLSDGEWHHLGAVKSGTAMSLYVDGSVAGSGTQAGNDTFIGTEVARIGSDPDSGALMNGTIDEVMIWTVAASDRIPKFHAVHDVRRYTSLSSLAITDGVSATVTTIDVVTYDAGLAAGQLLSVTSANLGYDLQQFTIQELKRVWQNATTIRYAATCGDAPIRLATAFP